MTGAPVAPLTHATSWSDEDLPPAVRAAGALLDAGRDGEAFRAAGALPVGDADALTLAAAEAIGLVAGFLVDARTLPEEDLGPRFPGVVAAAAVVPPALATFARRLAAAERWGRALAATERLDTVAPGALDAFVAALPPEQLHIGAPHVLRRLMTDPIPDPWEAQAAKRAFIRALGVDAAAVQLARLTSDGAPRVPQRLPLGMVDQLSETLALRRIALSDGSPVLMAPPPMFGLQLPRTVEPATPRPYLLVELPDALVTSRSNFVISGGRAIHDVTPDEWGRINQDLALDPLIVDADRTSALVLVTPPDAATHHLPEAFTLVGVHSHAFGHWMYEHLMRLWPWLALPESAGVPVLIDAQMPPQHRQSLELFVGDAHPIVVLQPGQTAQVDRLWWGTMPMFIAMSPTPDQPKPQSGRRRDGLRLDGAAFVRALSAARAAAATVPPLPDFERVYLTRRDTQHRHVLNRPAVEALLAARGFRSLDFAELSFRDQIAVIRGSRQVVMASGSASLLVLFAEPGTVLSVLMHEGEGAWVYDWQLAVATELEQRLLLHISPIGASDSAYQKHANYRVDLDDLAALLDAMAEAPAAVVRGAPAIAA